MDIYGKLENVRNTQEVSHWHLTFTKKVPKGVLTIGNRWVVTLNHHSGEALFDRNGFQVRFGSKPIGQPAEEEAALLKVFYQLLHLFSIGIDAAPVELEYMVDEDIGKFLLNRSITASPEPLRLS